MKTAKRPMTSRPMTSTEKILAVLPPPGDCLTTMEIAEKSAVDRRQAAKSLDVLRRRGLARRVWRGCYRLTAAGEAFRAAGRRIKSGPGGPLTGRRRLGATAAAAAWAVMRVRKKFTVPDLQCLCDGLTAANAHKVIGKLLRAGYVRRLANRDPGTAPTSPGFVKYLLVRDTGPRAPFYSPKTDELIDPNTGESHKMEGTT